MKNLVEYIDEGNNMRYEDSIAIFNTSDAIVFWYEAGESFVTKNGTVIMAV